MYIRKEYESSCTVVTEHFITLAKSVRFHTAEAVVAAIDIVESFSKATDLDKVQDFHIAATKSKISSQISVFVEKKHKLFQQQIRNYKFVDAHAILKEIEELHSTTQAVEFNIMGALVGIAIQSAISFILILLIGELDAAITKLPGVIKEIIETRKWRDIAKIDFCIDQLEQLRAGYEGQDLGAIISSIEENMTQIASQKDALIGQLVSEFNVDEAAEELLGLTYLTELKCLADFKAKGRCRFYRYI